MKLGNESRKWLWGALAVAWVGGRRRSIARDAGLRKHPGPRRRSPSNVACPEPNSTYGGLPTIVIMGHPKCPCTRATIGELAVMIGAPAQPGHGCRRSCAAPLERPTVGTTPICGAAPRNSGATVMTDLDEVEVDRFQYRSLRADDVVQHRRKNCSSAGASPPPADTLAITSTLLDCLPRNLRHLERTRTPVFGCALRTPKSLTAGEKL